MEKHNFKEAQKYVGGNWDQIGKKSFEFLINKGLKPNHKLLDIGCGCGRSGRFFIDYLDKNNYYGLEKHAWLMSAGIAEMGDLIDEKLPHLLINDDFYFYNDVKDIDFAWAKSVFTHLTKDKIEQCLNNLKLVLKKEGVFYATIFEGNSSNNLENDHDNKKFQYNIAEIEFLALGWNVEKVEGIGAGKQTMLKFTLIK